MWGEGGKILNSHPLPEPTRVDVSLLERDYILVLKYQEQLMITQPSVCLCV